MESVNFVVHLMSGIGFVVVIYLYLGSRKRHQFVIECINASVTPNIKKQMAQNPLKFLRQFSRAFDIPFKMTDSQVTEITRIDALPWIRTHLKFGINQISCNSHENHIHVVVQLRINNEVSKLNVSELKASLGAQAEIKLQ